jgi:hypothetical protein
MATKAKMLPAIAAGFGFKEKEPPIVKQEEVDRARGAVSPLGGQAVWPMPQRRGNG